MGRLSGKQIRKAYAFLVVRDGEHCAICSKRPPAVFLEVDHKDGNPQNNPKDGSNWQLLCRRDNRKKNPRGKGKRKRAQYQETVIDDPLPTTWESKKSLESEPAYRHWLYETVQAKLAKNEHITVETAINAGAEKAKCSPETAKRYLKKMCSDTGLFIIVSDPLLDEKVIAFRHEIRIGVEPEELKGESVE